MKRIALVLVTAMLLALCACGKAQAPLDVTEGEITTVAATSAPILEPVILRVIQTNWDGFALVYGYDPPKPNDLGSCGVDVGSTFTFQPGSFNFTAMYVPGGGGFSTAISIDAFNDSAVTVHFQTDGMVKRHPGGGISLMTDDPSEYDWVVEIPYGETYDVVSQTMDGGFTFEFTFAKNH